MRELTLPETGYFAGLLLLSLVLPILMSLRGPRNLPSSRESYRACLKTIWIGQTLLAFAGLGVLISAPAAPCAALLGVMNCLGFSRMLLRQCRAARSA